MEQEMPKFIIAITVVLIVFAVGVVMFLSILTPLDLTLGQNQTFTVTDPTVSQRCTIAFEPDDATVVVKQYNGNEWVSVSSIYVTISGQIVTVDSAGLQG